MNLYISDIGLIKLQWGRNILVTEIQFPEIRLFFLILRFNGAVTFWLRKSYIVLQFSIASTSFNGAVTFWLRKYQRDANDKRNVPKLQWGRNILVTEIAYAETFADRAKQLQWGRNILVTEI